jgi:hypothetical protein
LVLTFGQVAVLPTARNIGPLGIGEHYFGIHYFVQCY